ncbi:MAG: lytic transglycosylase domain-containing protein [Lentimonas sp.]
MAIILSVVAGILVITLSQTIGNQSEVVSPEEVWAYIKEQAPSKDLDPEFVYAIAWAESSLNARARSSVARGMMQITRAAWTDVSDESYHHAWDWRTNVRVGIDYLAHCREDLKRHGEFTYSLLAASYRYGPYYVRANDFKMSKMEEPENLIYKSIFAGHNNPIELPEINLAINEPTN